jgi:hypothetical protein
MQQGREGEEEVKTKGSESDERLEREQHVSVVQNVSPSTHLAPVLHLGFEVCLFAGELLQGRRPLLKSIAQLGHLGSLTGGKP